MSDGFDFLEAFAALNEISDEEVVGMLKPAKKKRVTEGQTFKLNDSSDMEEASNFINQDSGDDYLEVIDADADSLEHIKNKESYIGQVLLQCNKCQAKKCIDIDKLVPDENDPKKYNVEDDCPYCHTSGYGYTEIGQIGKREDAEEEKPEENTSSDDTAAIDNDQKEEDEASIENNEPALDSVEDSETGNNTEPYTADNNSSFEEITDEFPDWDENGDEVEQKDFDETDTSETDDLDVPNFGDLENDSDEEKIPEEDVEAAEEYDKKKKEESLEEAFEFTNERAKEAWMLNLVISSMNDEEAYESWIYTWPDGESKEQCEDDFSDKDAFDELKRTFLRIYSDEDYHEAGLYKAPDDVVQYAHKVDDLLGLTPIENITPKKEELKESINVPKNATVGDFIKKLFPDDCERLQSIVVSSRGEKIFEGSCEDLNEDKTISKLHVDSFAAGNFGINIDCKQKNHSVGKLLDYFNDKLYDGPVVNLYSDGEYVFSGYVNDAKRKFGECAIDYIEVPQHFFIEVTEDLSGRKIITNESLFESICRVNGLNSFKVRNFNTDEYWLNESLSMGEDLDEIYKRYILPTKNRKLIERFKSETDYRDAIDEARENLYGEKHMKKNNIKPYRVNAVDESFNPWNELLHNSESAETKRAMPRKRSRVAESYEPDSEYQEMFDELQDEYTREIDQDYIDDTLDDYEDYQDKNDLEPENYELENDPIITRGTTGNSGVTVRGPRFEGTFQTRKGPRSVERFNRRVQDFEEEPLGEGCENCEGPKNESMLDKLKTFCGKKSKNESVLKTRDFDADVNQYFKEAYKDPIHYQTQHVRTYGSRIIAEGILSKEGYKDIAVKFNLKPIITEDLGENELAYKVTNNISEEVFEYTQKK